MQRLLLLTIRLEHAFHCVGREKKAQSSCRIKEKISSR